MKRKYSKWSLNGLLIKYNLKMYDYRPTVLYVSILSALFSFPQMYNFTNFAMSLNELEPGMEAVLAPTDCRFRPDIRAMENGNMSKYWSLSLLFLCLMVVYFVAVPHCCLRLNQTCCPLLDGCCHWSHDFILRLQVRPVRRRRDWRRSREQPERSEPGLMRSGPQGGLTCNSMRAQMVHTDSCDSWRGPEMLDVPALTWSKSDSKIGQKPDVDSSFHRKLEAWIWNRCKFCWF